MHVAWNPAIAAMQSQNITGFEEKLFSQGLYQSVQNKDWQVAAEILDRGLNKYPDNSSYRDLASKLQVPMMEWFWRQSNFSSVEKRLQKMLVARPGDSQIHHNLAILYTRWLLSQDDKNVKGIPSDFWKRSIGHWAVVLSDLNYWIAWKSHRGWIDENEFENKELNNLIDIQLPDLLKSYFNDCESRIDAPQVKKTNYYQVLIDQELDTMVAVRMLERNGA